MKPRTSRKPPPLLVIVSALFFGAAYFTVRFPEAPGASAGSYVSTFLIAAPPCVALARYLGLRRAILALAALSVFAFAIETIGVATGFPYGEFYYGDSLGPKLFGLVPYLLPVSYAPLVLGAVAAADSPPLLRIAGGASLLVLTDAVLDPGAATLGFWAWPNGGLYYGVPISNYAGWLLSGALASALLVALGGGWLRSPRPGLLDGLVVSISFWTGVAAFSGLLFPALLGCLLFAGLLHRRSRLRRRTTSAAGWV